MKIWKLSAKKYYQSSFGLHLGAPTILPILLSILLSGKLFRSYDKKPDLKLGQITSKGIKNEILIPYTVHVKLTKNNVLTKVYCTFGSHNEMLAGVRIRPFSTQSLVSVVSEWMERTWVASVQLMRRYFYKMWRLNTLGRINRSWL